MQHPDIALAIGRDHGLRRGLIADRRAVIHARRRAAHGGLALIDHALVLHLDRGDLRAKPGGEFGRQVRLAGKPAAGIVCQPAALRHEVADDAMEDAAVIEILRGQLFHPRGVLRGKIGMKLHDHQAGLGLGQQRFHAAPRLLRHGDVEKIVLVRRAPGVIGRIDRLGGGGQGRGGEEGSNHEYFSNRRFSTEGETKGETSPPRRAISFTRRDATA